MTTVEIVLSALVILGTVNFLIHRRKVEAEIDRLHNRIGKVSDSSMTRVTMVEDNIKNIAKNAQGIASNALSSAQRAESRIAKHITETTKVTNE